MSNKIKDIELRSEEVQEILTRTPVWMIRWGNTLFLLLIVILLLLSWFVKYPDIVSSEAIITTIIPPQKEFARATGKIDTLFVKNAENVLDGKPLAIIENTANYKDVFLLKSITDTITISKDAFNFPINKLPILFLGDIETSFDLFEINYIQYTLNKKLNPFSYETIANKNSIAELKRRLVNLQSQKLLNKKELEFNQKDLKRSKSLFDKGVISEKEFETKQLEFLQSERNYKNMASSISQLREAISNTNKTSKGTEISQIREEMTLFKNVIQSFNQLKKSIKDWEMLYVLSSKMEGKVSFLNYWSQNQTVNQGDLVFTIIPKENSSFISKLKTPAQNLGKVKIGQTVNIKLQNYPDYEFGVLTGKVNHISEISDKEGFYTIDVSLPKKLITSYKKEIEFKQEMRGTAEIITEDLRLIQRFFYQFNKMVDR
ncbi:HlyD family efflux transporter periplasmic adaptor subunit [Polaribacter batillariae]|uniref:HlyD family efflux transporter periplasmic adaptor subunit n=1 Tax=Polaribacter batillariae TaxID=2808900 RepID=A0ABX7STQ6_9FLAO|nr:HlyD family efflux transporter periplasmic adaptor subunit [Polaribacter batillariae]QTD36735.1 HlyD family efflux transporter periplasmic adaptor subunit [Polaribacter batillariae]